jgi:hypothetical protein
MIPESYAFCSYGPTKNQHLLLLSRVSYSPSNSSSKIWLWWWWWWWWFTRSENYEVPNYEALFNRLIIPLSYFLLWFRFSSISSAYSACVIPLIWKITFHTHPRKEARREDVRLWINQWQPSVKLWINQLQPSVKFKLVCICTSQCYV